MSEPEAREPPSDASLSVEIDLRDESHRFFRQRAVVTGVGVGFGTVIIGLGGYSVEINAGAGIASALLVGGLLIVLGVMLTLTSVRSGLINPATALRADDTGLTFTRRWRGTAAIRWTDLDLVLLIEDLGPDPRTSAEEKRHMFFSGSGRVYGTLPSSEIGPLLDVVRSRGLSVRVAPDAVRLGLTRRQIRRITISRRPLK